MGVEVISSAEQFKEVIKKGKVIIDFWAPWCGPCRAISPVFERFSNSEDAGDVGWYKLNIDEVEVVATEYGVSAIPTFIYFDEGEKKGQVRGANQEALLNLVKEAKK